MENLNFCSLFAFSSKMASDDTYGFNVSNDADNFFQSDQDLEKRRQREQRTNYTIGGAVQLKSKVLHLLPEGNKLYAATAGFAVTTLDLDTKKIVANYVGHKGPVTSVTLNGPNQLITGSWDKTAAIWDVETRKQLQSFASHSDFVKSVANCDANTFFSGSSDNTIRKWDIRTGRVTQVIKSHTGPVEYLNVHDGKLYSASSDGTIRRYDDVTHEVDLLLKGHDTTVFHFAFGTDNVLFSASADKTVRKWDLSTGLEEAQFVHKDWVKAVAVAGQFIVATGRDETVTVWDLQTDSISQAFTGHFDEVTTLATQGRTIISGSIDCTIRFWDIDGEVPDSSKPAPVVKSILTAEEEAELADLLE